MLDPGGLAVKVLAPGFWRYRCWLQGFGGTGVGSRGLAVQVLAPGGLAIQVLAPGFWRYRCWLQGFWRYRCWLQGFWRYRRWLQGFGSTGAGSRGLAVQVLAPGVWWYWCWLQGFGGTGVGDPQHQPKVKAVCCLVAASTSADASAALIPGPQNLIPAALDPWTRGPRP